MTLIALIEGIVLWLVASELFDWRPGSEIRTVMGWNIVLGFPVLLFILRRMLPNLMSYTAHVLPYAVALFFVGALLWEVRDRPDDWIQLPALVIACALLSYGMALVAVLPMVAEPPPWRRRLWTSPFMRWPGREPSLLEAWSRRRSARQTKREPRQEHAQDDRHTGNGSVDAWAVLGLGPGASRTEVRTAYRERMLAFHPDRLLQIDPLLRELAEKEAKAVNEAYDVLVRQR